MNTEYAIGNIRLRFESRARRRWFVVLFYAVVAVLGFAPFSAHANTLTVWIICGCLILWVALWIALTGLAGDVRARSDEREMHRREQARSRAYSILGYGIVASFWAACFGGPNSITPLSPLALREFLVPLPSILLMATLLLYVSLPQAILLWTEPDMEDPQTAS